MRRLLPVTLWLALLITTPASADPGIRVHYQDDLLRVTLDGSFAGAYFQVWRSGELLGAFDPLALQATLCTGDCFVTDSEVTPGKTYYYRFDLQLANGGLVSYGPYAVVVPDSPVGVNVSPNPSAGRARIDLSLPGSGRRDGAVEAQARLIDLQGRTVRVLYAGRLSRGTTSVPWDGRAEGGRALGAGIYFVRLDTPLGSSTTRLIRFH